MAGTITGSTVGSVNGRPSGKDEKLLRLYQRAVEVRESTGDNELFRRTLASEADITTDQQEFSAIAWNGSDLANKFQKTDLSLDLTMTCLSGSDLVIDLVWEIDIDYNWIENDGGEKPVDLIGLSWEPRDYEFRDVLHTEEGTRKRKTGYRGVVFEYTDIPCSDWHDEGFEECGKMGTSLTVSNSCGFQIEVDATEDPSDRKVYVDYTHTWNKVEINSVGIDSDGALTVNLSNNKKWNGPNETSVRESEAR
jgi:hypothetical protein